MADPRFNHYGQRTGWHKQSVHYDSPLSHGWTRCGVDPVTGFDVFRLGDAFTRSTTPEEKLMTGYDCYVTIGDDCYGYTGGWKAITADVRRTLGLPEPYFLPGYVIPAEAFGDSK